MSAKTVTLRNAVDTWVGSAKPSKKHASDATIYVAAGEAVGLVYFAFPASRGSTIVSATLTLYTKGAWSEGVLVGAQRISEKWTAGSVTWNKRPNTAGPYAQKSDTATKDGFAYTLNVAPLLQQVADGAPWYGFNITSDDATLHAFRSAQAGGLKPVLTVTWSEAPDTPTRLSPSGGQAVNAAKPVLSMDYTDTSGSTTLAALQVQIDPDPAGFATPDFDSGRVLTTGSMARLDLSTTAYPGLAEGATTYWRGRVQDGAGEWSGWSTPTAFTRSAKGVVTVTSPSSGAVDDFTPVITWTFTKPQSKWQVIVTDSDLAEVFNSGQVAGTETACTVDDARGKAVLTTGETYTVEVRAWDTESRIGTVDDPAYSTATLDFAVVPVAGVAPVTNLRTETITVPPGVRVLFDRADAPDALTILRDGKPIETNVDASENRIDGSNTYAVVLTNVRPNIAQTITVHAIVNGEASPGASIEAVARVAGAWLVDPDDPTGSALFIAATTSSTLALAEDAATLTPLGAGESVRITQGMRGYEGTVTGVLISEMGHTRDEWVDRALRLRATPGQRLRLIIGTEVLDVVIGNLTVRPTGDSSPGKRPISFDFWQVGKSRIAAGV